MILIGGLEDTNVELPNSDLLNYVVESSPEILEIKLKSSAKSPDCLAIFIHEEWSGVAMPDEVRKKTTFFQNTKDLMVLLGNGFSSSASEEEEPVVEEPAQLDFTSAEVLSKQPAPDEATTSSVATDTNSSEEGVFEPVSIQSVDEEDFATITLPELVEGNVESLTVKVAMLEKLLANKDELLSEVRSELSDLYKLQEIQLLEMRKDYEEKISQANEVISELNKAVPKFNLTDSQKKIATYSSYMDNEMGIFSSPLTEEAIQEIKSFAPSLHIMCAGAGKSLSTYTNTVAEMVKSDKGYVVLDFTGEMFLRFQLQIKNQFKEHSMMLKNPEIPLHSIMKKVNNSYIAFSRTYNDIALLGMDWVDLLKRVASVAEGRPILLLFGSFTSFVVRATVARLAPAGKNGRMFCFVHSDNLVLYSVYTYLPFIKKELSYIVGLDYIAPLAPMYENLGKQTRVKTFSGDLKLKDFVKELDLN